MKMGLRIAVCDDVAEDRAAICTALKDCFAARDVCAGIEVFSHPDELLSVAHAKPFDLYFLDIILPMVDGLSVAREIRGFQEKTPIVFLTNSRDHALEAFGVQAFDYVVKPWTHVQVNAVLDRFLSFVGRESANVVSLKTTDGVCRVDVGTIVYVTAAKAANCKTLHLRDGKTIDVRMTLEALAEVCSVSSGRASLFADGRYALVNPYHVRSIVGETVTFGTGETLRIHRSSVVALRRMVADLPW